MPPSIANSRITSRRRAPSARLMPSSVRRSSATSENTSTISSMPLNSENAPRTTNRSVKALPHRSAWSWATLWTSITRKPPAPLAAAANGVLPRVTAPPSRAARRLRTSGSWASALNSGFCSAAGWSRSASSRRNLSASRPLVSGLPAARAMSSRAGADDIARKSRRAVASSTKADLSSTVTGQELSRRCLASPALTTRT